MQSPDSSSAIQRMQKYTNEQKRERKSKEQNIKTETQKCAAQCRLKFSISCSSMQFTGYQRLQPTNATRANKAEI